MLSLRRFLTSLMVSLTLPWCVLLPLGCTQLMDEYSVGGPCSSAADCPQTDDDCTASLCLYGYCTTASSNAYVPGLRCIGACDDGGFVETADKPFRPDCGACDGYVEESACPPLCDDGAVSGTETGIDCGGPDCAPCKAYQPCARNEDCASGVCEPSAIYCGNVPCCALNEDGHPKTYEGYR